MRAWCGGEAWPTIVGELTSAWAPESRRAASAAVGAVIDGGPHRSVVAHGDFGPHNVLLGAAGAALIDPDNAGPAEPGTDLAPLLGFYAVEELSHDFSRERLLRAAAIRRSLPLQVAAAAELAADVSLRDHALANFLRREQRR
ncbi:MAG: phosphotransferase family protein [Microbacterium sp.]|uniref:phosphotransferase family protein n=1 Tax=Microbacterium sp. TaxID=51671 RepID=UPI003F7FD672